MELVALFFLVLPFIYLAGTLPKGARLSELWRRIWITSVPAVFVLSGIVGNMWVPELKQLWTLMGGAGLLVLMGLLIVYVRPQLKPMKVESHE